MAKNAKNTAIMFGVMLHGLLARDILRCCPPKSS
jgi:hypothetical protein